MYRLLLISLLTAAAIPPALAAAQLEEVIVTAQKRAQNLQDVPMAITALGRALLEDNEINNIEDLTKLVPSMQFTPGDDPTNSSIRVRGVGTSVFSIAVEPNVSVVLDEVPLARNSLASFEFADLERVEVLRGPQGTLFGKNSTAGLIHIITRDPAEEFEAFVRSSAEEQKDFGSGLTKVQLGASGPLSDTVGLRVTGYAKKTDGLYIDVLNGNKHVPDAEIFGARSKLRWDFSDTLAFRLNLEYQKSDAASNPLTFRSVNPNVEAASPEIRYGKENRTTKTFGTNVADTFNKAISLNVQWDLGDYNLTSVTGWRDWGILRNLGIPELDGDRINVRRNGGTRDIETLTQELRVSYTGSEKLEYTAGFLWFYNELDNDFDRLATDIPPALVAAAFGVDLSALPNGGAGEITQFSRSIAYANTENLGFFGQGTWHFSDSLHLTAGLRYIKETLKSAAETETALIAEDSNSEAQSTQLSIPETALRDKAVTGTVSLAYDWGEDTNLYGTVATGYRGGAFDLANSDLESAFNDPVDAETALAFELGLKTRLWDNRLELNIAVFQTVFEDFQAQVVDLPERGPTDLVGSSNFRLANAGELETRGVEIDFKVQVLEHLFIYGSVLFNRAVFNEFTTQCFTGQQPGEAGGRDENDDGSCDLQDVDGGVLPNAPKRSFSVTARYEQPFGQSMGFAQVTGRWQDDVQFIAEQHPLTIQDSYSVVDLRVGWAGLDDRLEVAAYAKNLFNQFYVSGFFPLSLENDRRDVTHFIGPDATRTIGFSISYAL